LRRSPRRERARRAGYGWTGPFRADAEILSGWSGARRTLKSAGNLIFAARTRTGIDNSISSSRYHLRQADTYPFHPSPRRTSSTAKVAGPDRVCTLRTYNILEHFPTDNIAPEASDVEVKVAGVARAAPSRFECDTSGVVAPDGYTDAEERKRERERERERESEREREREFLVPAGTSSRPSRLCRIN